jgi:26S proteasome regulatory subunit N9
VNLLLLLLLLLFVASERTKLTIDGVEFLLMKALALHLIEGIIDQVRW